MATSNSHFSLSKQDKFESKSHIQSSPTSNSSIGFQNPPSNHQNQQVNHTEESASPVLLETESASPVFLEAESQLLVDDNDDGFRTPTSLDHKIPETKQCPPAPRKIRAKPSLSIKRKLDSLQFCWSLQIDLTDEIESMFPPSVIKKARRDRD